MYVMCKRDCNTITHKCRKGHTYELDPLVARKWIQSGHLEVIDTERAVENLLDLEKRAKPEETESKPKRRQRHATIPGNPDAA